MTDQTTIRPMNIGRAQHMDLTRASDDDLQRAFSVLDGYDTAGKASAYTQAKFDDRIQDIFDEMDRRAGCQPVYVERLPLAHYYPGPAEADDAPAAAELRKDAEVTQLFRETGTLPGLTSSM